MDTSQRDAFAAVLRRHRVAAGLTQQDLAERAGISTRSVSDLEREINLRPRHSTAEMLADGLGLDGAERKSFLGSARIRRSTAGPPESHAQTQFAAAAHPLLGRQREMQTIEDMLFRHDARLLTLTGPGGVGKTRLAIEVARRQAHRFADGLLFVRLDGLTAAALVLPTLANALQMVEGDGVHASLDRVAGHLAIREHLIVLDNMEHLLAAAEDVATLVRQASQTTFLVTSREALRVREEQVIPIAPLPRPDLDRFQRALMPADLDSPAVELFTQRALAQRPNLMIEPTMEEGRANLATIAEICHRLDGLPLAIELAAAQIQFLSPAALLALLKKAGLPLLVGGDRDQPARLQTMDAAISWSYDLLSSDEQILFRALSVFAGGFTLAAAAAVLDLNGSSRAPSGKQELAAFSAGSERPWVGAVPDLPDIQAEFNPRHVATITSLAWQNMILLDSTLPDDLPLRFRMLEPLRLFALEQLRAADEEPAVRLCHARYFASTAEALDALTIGPDPEVWIQLQALDLDNFRAAQDWALTLGADDLTARLTAFVAQLWLISGLHEEGRQRIVNAIAVDGGSASDIRWYLRFWAGNFAVERGDFVKASAYAHEIMEIAEVHGDGVGMGVGLTLLSRAIGSYPDQHEEAAELAGRAANLLEPLGKGEWTGWAWSRFGIEHHRLGRLEEARDAFRQSLKARSSKGCEGCVSYSLALLGALYLDLGQPHAAIDAYRESLALTVKHGNHSLTLAVLLGLADAAWQFGTTPRAQYAALGFYGAAEALGRRHGFDVDRAEREARDRWLAPMRLELGGEDGDRLIASGAVMSLVESVAAAHGIEVSPNRRVIHGGAVIPSLFSARGTIE